jgi:hypothetical protein
MASATWRNPRSLPSAGGVLPRRARGYCVTNEWTLVSYVAWRGEGTAFQVVAQNSTELVRAPSTHDTPKRTLLHTRHS